MPIDCPHCGKPLGIEYDLLYGVLETDGRLIHLSPREAQILGLLIKMAKLDAGDVDIGKMIHISPNEARVYVSQLRNKLVGSAYTIINHWHGRYTLHVEHERVPA